ncbi:MAG: lysozyme, partial [Rivularia sp. ALOHA_DT_140]|nr:lysozyme [Rivularia sp. ALOHA_DT_140]
MRISENCLNLIKKWEGFYSEAYLCPANVPTIGYGTIRYPDGRKVRLGDTISEPVAEAFLHDECAECARGVTKAVKVDINQNQFDALVSFTYNLGIGAFQRSTLLKKINAGKFDEAAK